MNADSLHTSLLDNLSTAVILLDGDLCLYHLNPAAEALLDTSDRRCRMAYVADVFPNCGELVDALHSVQRNHNLFIARKAQLTLQSGRSMTVDYALTPVDDVGSNFVLMEIQGLDRYHIGRREALLSTHETTLELVRGLSHEIKNPLGGIRGAAQLLGEELGDNRELQDYTNIIIGEADRLVNLVDRLTGSYKKPHFQRFNIHEVVERVRLLMEAETRGGILLVRDYDPSIPELYGDVEQLIQALLNLCRNAMQALREGDMGGVRPRIVLRTRAVSHATIGAVMHRLVARVEIIDNGPGVDPAIIDSIFYPLISGRAEGSGLGLSIAQTIAKNHQGLIECESQPGRTNFILSLPISNRGEAHE